MTLNLGLRYAYFNAFVPAQNVPAGSFVPARRYPEYLTWRSGTTSRRGLARSIDLFGTGKTALKASLSRYLGGQGAGAAQAKNPQSTVVDSASRAWTDTNGDYDPNLRSARPG